MKFYIAITNNDWFRYLSDLQPDEVNFWRPSGRTIFRAVPQGSPFLFKLHSPLNYIVGGGFFLKFERFPLSIVWDAFKEKNGASDFSTFTKMIHQHRDDLHKDPVIGCIILSEPFFLKRGEWIELPENWSDSIQQGKTYDSKEYHGKLLWEKVKAHIFSYDSVGKEILSRGDIEDSVKFGAEYITRARLGQGSFKALVTSAYHKKCAISGDKVLPILQAAHIKPFSESGPNRINNGLLLRSDLHILFDKGYLTITPNYNIEVSRAIKDEFDNGKNYYIYHGKKLFKLPDNDWEMPSNKYLTWHNEKRFIG